MDIKKMCKRINKLAQTPGSIQMAKEPGVWDKANPVDGEKFFNYYDALTKATGKDAGILKSLVSKFNYHKKNLETKIDNQDMLSEFEALVASRLSKLKFEAPMTAFGANELISKNYSAVLDILKSSYQEATGPTFGLKDKKDSVLDKSWTVSQWRKVLRGLLNRAKSQMEAAQSKLDQATTEVMKKKYQAMVNTKELYMNSIYYLGQQLDQLVKSKGLSGNSPISDNLLTGYSSKKERGSSGEGESRGGGRRGYPGSPLGEGKESEGGVDYLSTPFSSKDGNLYIKQLLRAYGLAGDYPLLMKTQAPSILDYNRWTSHDLKLVRDKELAGSQLDPSEYVAYVHALRQAISAVVDKYTENAGDNLDPKQINVGKKLLASLLKIVQDAGAPTRGTENKPEGQKVEQKTEQTQKVETEQKTKPNYRNWITINYEGGLPDFVSKLEDLGYKESPTQGYYEKRDANGKIFRMVNVSTGDFYEVQDNKFGPARNVANLSTKEVDQL